MNSARRFCPGWLGLALIFGTVAHGEEKNGLQVSVTKKTLDRADTRANYYYYDRIDRTQGLKVTIKNTTFRPMPEGEIDWTIIVRRYLSGTPEGFTGTEKLKALKPAESVDMVIGSAQITGWRDWYDQAKDKMEHQVVVRHGDKEMIRLSSTSGFDALAKRANLRKASSAPAPAKVPPTTLPRSPAAPAAPPPRSSATPILPPPPAPVVPPLSPAAVPAFAAAPPAPVAPADSFFGIPTTAPPATPAPKERLR